MTMDCDSARDLLLEADPVELRGDGDSPLAAHLRGCADCRARAEAILAAEAQMDAALRTLAAPRGTRIIPLRPRRSMVMRIGAAAVPLAAAAVAAGIVLFGRQAAPPPERPGVITERIARSLFPARPVVAVAPGRNATVLKTRDPGITLVWID